MHRDRQTLHKRDCHRTRSDQNEKRTVFILCHQRVEPRVVVFVFCGANLHTGVGEVLC